MQRRPQPSRRRGLLRAIVAAVILIAVILAILLLVSSLTAAPAKAPTVPPTPTPPSLTPPSSPTSTAKAKPTPTPRTHVTPSSTKKDIAAALRPPGLLMRMPSQPPDVPDAVAAPGDTRVAYFVPAGGAYDRTPLKVWSRAAGTTRTISYGDRFVRPVWSPDGTRLLFARVSETTTYPGARWTLLQVDVRTGHVHVLDRHNGLNLLPLGWTAGRPLYLVSTATDTSIFSIKGGQRQFISIMMPQVITAAFLSSDGKYVAFAAPSDCFFCTYDTFNLAMLHPVVGPSGGQSENDIAWSRDSRTIAVPLKDHIGVVAADSLKVLATYPVPAGLPPVWTHPMSFRRTERTMTLIDTVTRSTYVSTR